MDTLKTWDMLKIYSESDDRCNLEFKNTRCDSTIYMHPQECILYWKEFDKPFTISIGLSEDDGNINDEWELQKPSINFNEAFEAWYYEGKTIYCDVHNDEWTRTSANHVYDVFPAYAIADGKWFIKD